MSPGLHLYCLVPAGHPRPGTLRGIGGAAVETLRVGALEVWWSPGERTPRPDLDRIRAHDRVIRAATTSTVTPLPFRFGQWFADPDVLAAEVEGRAAGYGEALDAVAGALEFGVRLEERPAGAGAESPATLPDAAVAPGGRGAGTTYLRRLAQERARKEEGFRRGEEVLAELNRCVAEAVRRTRIDPVPAHGSVASAAYLVPRSQIHRYESMLDGFEREHAAVGLRRSGPWPPYSFADPGPGR